MHEYFALWGMLYGETFHCDSGGTEAKHVIVTGRHCAARRKHFCGCVLKQLLAAVYCVHVTYSASIRVFRLMSLFKFGERAFSHADCRTCCMEVTAT